MTITSTSTRLTDSLTDSLTITSITPACPAARLTPYGDDGMQPTAMTRVW